MKNYPKVEGLRGWPLRFSPGMFPRPARISYGEFRRPATDAEMRLILGRPLEIMTDKRSLDFSVASIQAQERAG